MTSIKLLLYWKYYFLKCNVLVKFDFIADVMYQLSVVLLILINK